MAKSAWKPPPAVKPSVYRGAQDFPGAIKVEPESVEYGKVVVGSSRGESFKVTNTGGVAVPILKSKPPIGGEFTATTSLPEGTTIRPGETLTETVTFTPTKTGPATDVWPINGEDTTGLHEVRFKGEGVAPPTLTASTASLALGSTSTAAELDGRMTFTNAGETPLEIEGTQSPSPPFRAIGLPARGTMLAPGEAVLVEVVFRSTTAGTFNDSLALKAQAGETIIALSATATTSSATTVTPPIGLVTQLTGLLSFTESKEPLPSLTRLQIRARAASNAHTLRARVSYTLSTRATVELTVYRQTLSHRCTDGARTCHRWIPAGIKRNVVGRRGANSLALSLATLSAGDYRLQATPISPSGLRGHTQYVRFSTVG